MKTLKQLLLTGIAVLLCTTMYAQAPQKFNYQAVARNNNVIIANTVVGIRIDIKDAQNGTILYQEVQGPTTNEFGIFSIEIGNGAVFIGSFSAIDWKSGSKWLEVEMDPIGGSNYISMGTSELLSVPYALQADHSLDSWVKNGNYIYNPNANNVGINTTSPDKSLSVGGGMDIDKFGQSDGSDGTANVALLNGLTFSGGSGEGIASNRMNTNPNQYGIDIYTNNLKRASITNDGKFGIGTTVPDKSFSLVGGMDIDIYGASDGSVGAGNNALRNGINFGSATSGEGIASNRNGANSNQFGIDFYTNFDRQLSITNTGNVGIGTATPTAKLDVRGDINLNGRVTTDATTDAFGTSNMIPVAYGVISGGGNIISSSRNIQGVTHAGPGFMIIGISGITYDDTYVTVVTCKPTVNILAPVVACAKPDGNGFQLDIFTYALPLLTPVYAAPLAAPLDSDFSFVVYHQ